MKFDDYELSSPIHDEMFLSGGVPRPHARLLFDALNQLSPTELASIQSRVHRTFSTESISFTVYGDHAPGEPAEERIIPVDPIPRIIAAADWLTLSHGLEQRVKALNRFLQDVYGPAHIIADGVVPADMILDCPQFRPEMRDFSQPYGAWVAVCGSDIIRVTDPHVNPLVSSGVDSRIPTAATPPSNNGPEVGAGFRVLEDNLRVPSGVSYMIANRKAAKASLPRLYRSYRVREVEQYGAALQASLRELSPNGKPHPVLALLTPGVYNSAYYEHMFLAREIGAELVEGKDLVVRDRVVYMRTTQGLQQVDVIYRRIDDDFLDPRVFRRDSLLGAPGLIEAARAGNVTLANAPGTGVADDKSVYVYVPDMVRYYLGEEPVLKNVETYLCRRPEDLEYTLDNIANLVVKRVGESGGYGMLIGPHATPEERDEYARAVRANPKDFISQPVQSFSRAPCLVPRHSALDAESSKTPDLAFEPRHVDLRPFILNGMQTRIVPGAFCRVALRRGSLVVNSSQGGGGKDVWVLAEDEYNS
ncbi:MAG: circularly permuted type 2 ATP-grasp protein [Chloroflexota bacterium]|nr:circularly permuted type 2 ATP-grasp protein [Chloroflexota bacterium]